MKTPHSRPVEEKIALLLELMSDPTTASTTWEVCCRIEAWGGDRLVPILLTYLESVDSSVVRLVLDVFRLEAELSDEHTLKDHVETFAGMLRHEDRLVRQAAIELLRVLDVSNDKVIAELQKVITTDEPCLAIEATAAALKLKPEEGDNLMPFLVETLNQDDPMIQRLVLDCVDLLGERAKELLPHIVKLPDETNVEDDAALAILKITGDDSYARQVVEKWRLEEEPDEPKVRDLAARELEEEIERILSERLS